MSGSGRPRLASWELLLPGATVLLSVAAAGEGTLPGDVAVARWVQRAPTSAATPLAQAAEWIGSALALALVAAAVALALAWRRRPAAAAFVLAAALIRVLNPLLKWVFDSPRPSPNLVRVTEQADGLGFPSGHAMGAMLLYGAIAALTFGGTGATGGRRLLRVAASVVIAVVGFGRVATGAHWPSDVVGGYLWGATLLLVLWRVRRAVMVHRRSPDRPPFRTA